MNFEDFPTEMQRRIERVVTDGRGYDRQNTSRIPSYLNETEIGLQIALANMDVVDGKLDLMTEAPLFSIKVSGIINRLKRAGLPYETITTAEGFKAAYDNVEEMPNISREDILKHILRKGKNTSEEKVYIGSKDNGSRDKLRNVNPIGDSDDFIMRPGYDCGSMDHPFI